MGFGRRGNDILIGGEEAELQQKAIKRANNSGKTFDEVIKTKIFAGYAHRPSV